MLFSHKPFNLDILMSSAASYRNCLPSRENMCTTVNVFLEPNESRFDNRGSERPLDIINGYLFYIP